ncbi:MAG: Tyrosine-protein kinase YwqD [Pseudomonadota bacterium]|jgi:Mrp family chromosome partitioning ATPase
MSIDDPNTAPGADEASTWPVAERLDGVRAVPPVHRTLVASHAPGGHGAEAYRTLYTSLRAARQGAPLGILGVASPARGDGRSTTAANLAFVAARETGREVALVDADLRRPGLHHLLGIDGELGLSDVLSNRADDEAALWRHPGGVAFVAGGRPEPEPARRLRHPRWLRFLGMLRARFDEVIIDLPPLALAESRQLLGHCDGAVLVVRAGRTMPAHVREALGEGLPAALYGMVLNAASEADAPMLATVRRALPKGA